MKSPHQSGLARYLAAAGSTRTADEGVRISLILLALERLGSASAGGILVAALLIPHVVAAPLIGSWVDRSARPARLMAVLILGFSATLFAAAQLTGHVPLWLIVVLLLGGGCCGPVITGGLTSQIPHLVGAERTPRAFGLDSLVYNLAGMAGPAVVGVVTVAAGAGVALTVLAGCALVGAVGIASLPISPAGRRLENRPPRLDGLRQLWDCAPLRTLTLTSAFGQVGLGALPVVATVLAASLGRASDAGLLLACLAGGALLGSLLSIWRPPADRSAGVAAVTMIAIGLPLALTGLASTQGVAALLFGLAGFFVGPFAAALFTARDRYADPSVRTQVFTIGAGMKVASAALGAVLVGTIVGLPVSTQLALVAAFPVVAGSVALIQLRDRSAAWAGRGSTISS